MYFFSGLISALQSQVKTRWDRSDWIGERLERRVRKSVLVWVHRKSDKNGWDKSIYIYTHTYIYISHVLRLLRMGCIEGTRWNIFTFWLSYHKNSNFWQTFWQSFLTHFYGNIFSNVIEHLCSLEISQSLHSRWVADIYGSFPWRFLQSRKMLVGAKVIAILHCWTLPFDIGIHSYINVVM